MKRSIISKYAHCVCILLIVLIANVTFAQEKLYSFELFKRSTDDSFIGKIKNNIGAVMLLEEFMGDMDTTLRIITVKDDIVKIDTLEHFIVKSYYDDSTYYYPHISPSSMYCTKDRLFILFSSRGIATYTYQDGKFDYDDITYFEDGNTSVKIARLDDYFTDDDYVFLLGFNKENIPILYKDDEYFSDKEKEEMGYDSSNTLNINKKIEVIKKIKNIKNIIISYKLYDANNIYTRSDLFSDANIIKDYKHLYTNSDMMNKIFLAGMLDDLVKYDVMNDDINLLISNYHIPYMEYDNSYHTIDKDKLYKYLNNKLLLSYTSLNNYYKCKFKYYLNHVLKINIIRDDFAILVGEVCHYILSCMDNDDFDIDTLFDNYLKTKREFSKREMFFLNNIKEEIVFIVLEVLKNFLII